MENDRKLIIIALVAVIVALCAGIGYMMLFNVNYENVSISSGTTMDVPTDEKAYWINESGIKLYSCPSKHVVVQSINSEENFTLGGAIAYAAIRDSVLEDARDVESYNGYDIKQNRINGTDFYIVSLGNDDTHDNILILSEDMNILKHMLDSIKFGKPTGQANSTVDASVLSSGNATSSSNDNQHSQDDPIQAIGDGYSTDYSDSDDSYYDYSYGGGGSDSGSYSSSSSSSSSSSVSSSGSSSSSSSVETTDSSESGSYASDFE